nr:trithorax group protein osa-like [Dermacentor andersoni]
MDLLPIENEIPFPWTVNIFREPNRPRGLPPEEASPYHRTWAHGSAAPSPTRPAGFPLRKQARTTEPGRMDQQPHPRPDLRVSPCGSKPVPPNLSAWISSPIPDQTCGFPPGEASPYHRTWAHGSAAPSPTRPAGFPLRKQAHTIEPRRMDQQPHPRPDLRVAPAEASPYHRTWAHGSAAPSPTRPAGFPLRKQARTTEPGRMDQQPHPRPDLRVSPCGSKPVQPNLGAWISSPIPDQTCGFPPAEASPYHRTSAHGSAAPSPTRPVGCPLRKQARTTEPGRMDQQPHPCPDLRFAPCGSKPIPSNLGAWISSPIPTQICGLPSAEASPYH